MDPHKQYSHVFVALSFWGLRYLCGGGGVDKEVGNVTSLLNPLACEEVLDSSLDGLVVGHKQHVARVAEQQC